ncbi:TonB-dependent receptor [Salmonella enterica subsp. enterica]|nr:TonB-dependent receptor [Salmonella enterica subsp. enterica]
METELKVPFNEAWKLSLNYTYNDRRDASVMAGNKAAFRLPFHTANGTLDDRCGSKTGHSTYRGIPGVSGPTAQQRHRAGTWSGTGAAWQATKNVKLRAGVLNVGDKDLKRDDYGYIPERTSLPAAVDYRF